MIDSSCYTAIPPGGLGLSQNVHRKARGGRRGAKLQFYFYDIVMRRVLGRPQFGVSAPALESGWDRFGVVLAAKKSSPCKALSSPGPPTWVVRAICSGPLSPPSLAAPVFLRNSSLHTCKLKDGWEASRIYGKYFVTKKLGHT